MTWPLARLNRLDIVRWRPLCIKAEAQPVDPTCAPEVYIMISAQNYGLSHGQLNGISILKADGTPYGNDKWVVISAGGTTANKVGLTIGTFNWETSSNTSGVVVAQWASSTERLEGVSGIRVSGRGDFGSVRFRAFHLGFNSTDIHIGLPLNFNQQIFGQTVLPFGPWTIR